MGVDLSTTNVLLGIMAGVSVLQALVLIGAGVAGFIVYRRITQLVNDLEMRQVAPLREKVEAILGDVKTVTSRVSQQTERRSRHSRGSRVGAEQCRRTWQWWKARLLGRFGEPALNR